MDLIEILAHHWVRVNDHLTDVAYGRVEPHFEVDMKVSPIRALEEAKAVANHYVMEHVRHFNATKYGMEWYEQDSQGQYFP